MLLMILKVKKLLEPFKKKNCKKSNQNEFRVKKVIQRRLINYMSNGKATMIILAVGLIKKT